MFLTQKNCITLISIDDDLVIGMGQLEAIDQGIDVPHLLNGISRTSVRKPQSFA